MYPCSPVKTVHSNFRHGRVMNTALIRRMEESRIEVGYLQVFSGNFNYVAVFVGNNEVYAFFLLLFDELGTYLLCKVSGKIVFAAVVFPAPLGPAMI
jgi:hypothetical protein